MCVLRDRNASHNISLVAFSAPAVRADTRLLFFAGLLLCVRFYQLGDRAAIILYNKKLLPFVCVHIKGKHKAMKCHCARSAH
jgi:hypothetical protein